MNLYLFNANDSAATYGIGTYLNELTFALRDSGISVHIVHLHSLRPEFEIEVRQPRKPVAWQGSAENRVEDWYIPEVRNNNTFSGSVQKLEDYYRNVVYLLRLNIKDTKDLIFHFNYNQSHVLAKELKAMFDCKTVAVIHYSKWMFEFQGNLQKLHELKAKPESQRTSFEQLLYTTDKYESRLYRETDRVIVLSQHMKHILESEYQLHIDKISVISNGLSDKGSFRINGRKSLRKKWRISDKEFIILFVGRLQPVKGLIFLMRAFRKVLAKYPDCRLMIAGNGSYDTYMQETKDICTKISFTGLLDRQALSELYQIANIGVVPSLYEPFGYVAIEMMMHALPVIVTKTGGLDEIVEDGVSGLKVPVRTIKGQRQVDVKQLSEKIRLLLDNPAYAQELGENGRKRFLEKFELSVFKEKMLNLYTTI